MGCKNMKRKFHQANKKQNELMNQFYLSCRAKSAITG